MNRFIKLARNPWLLAGVGTLATYSLIGFLLVPFLVRHYTPKLTADLLKRQATVGEVHFNPFQFTFEAKDLALTEMDGEPVAALKRLFLDFEPHRFITRRTWTLKELSLEGTVMNVVQNQEGKLNFVKIAESLSQLDEPPPPSDEPPPRVLVERLILADGSVKFTDLSKATPLTKSVEHLDLELKEFSTLPDRQGALAIDAALPDGGKLTWKGDLSLNPVASSGELKIESLRLATLWNFAKHRLNIAEPAGGITFGARYKFSQTRDKTELLIDNAAFTLAGLVLADANSRLLELEEIGFDKVSADLFARTVRVPSFVVRKGRIRAAMDDSGQVNWQTLVKPEPEGGAKAPPQPAPAAAQAPPASPWKLKIDNFKIAEIGLDYADASRKGPFAVSVGSFGLGLAAEVEAGAGAPKAVVDGLGIRLEQIALAQPGTAAPLLGWDSFQVEGGRLDLEKQEVAIQRAVLTGGGTAVVRDADGALHPIDIFQPKAGAATPAESEEKPREPPQGKPWSFALSEFSLQGFGVGLTDRSFSPELVYNLDGISLSTKNISNDGKTPVAFDVRLDVRQGGALQVSGTASPKGDMAQAKVKLDRFDLKQLQPIVGQFAALRLDSADLATELAIDFHQAEPTPKVKVTGKADLNSLKLTQTADGKLFLAWKTLGVTGIDFSLAPDKLAVKEVRIVKPETAIHIFKDKSTNIAAIFKPQKPSKRATNPTAKADAAKPSGKKSDKEQPFPLTVARVRIDDAEIDFADESLVLPFATHITDFDGAATGISLAPKSRTTLKFAGRVGEYGEAKVDGSLSPMDIKNYSHVDVVFDNVAMAALSPYSATFAGRRIQSGKLNLDLKYRIENSKLESENNILLEDFTLGEAIESPNAMNLPLDLAIALLTDSEGKIKASVPVRGDMNNPQFAYGGLVWDAFVTLITKVVTAPFNALASVFGGSEEPLDSVLFEPARDVLPPPEREKLSKVAEGLAQRPNLELTIVGRYGPKLDGEAIRSLQVRRTLAEKMGVALHEGEEPDQPAFSDAATQRALEKLADQRGGADKVQTEYLKEAGKPPQRVGVMAGLTGKASETPDFYEKLFKYLVEMTPLPPSELETLATRRSKAALEELTKRSRFDRKRLTVGKPAPTDDNTAGNVPTKLELKAD
ncbi:MAG: hypothetical protein H6R26_1222 [Proteobacteria bacterium]|nr:hypothetical protein [Pseudomonadota bacterium]